VRDFSESGAGDRGAFRYLIQIKDGQASCRCKIAASCRVTGVPKFP